MDFSLSDEQRTLKDATLEFAKKELRDDLITRDRDGVFPNDLWKKCATFGIQGMPFPQAYGGQDSDILTTVLAMEALGNGCKDNGLLFALNAQMWSVQMPIHMFGSEEQKHRYLTPMCQGDMIGAHGMSEPDSGSDAFSLTTSARKEGHSYILNGAKTFVSNAPVADLFVVFANTNRSKGFMGISAFLIDRQTPGLHVGKNIGKMGLRTSPWSEVVMEDCRIDEGQRLGKEGNGAGIFEDSMAWERSFILANYVGAMERQLETCITYARTRKQFGKPIGKFQSVANRIVDMKVRLETARHLLYKVAWMMDKKSPSVMDAAILKLYLSENWIKSCLDATQIHGGYGFTTEYEVERDLRDSIGSTLYSGTSEMQRNLIARHLHL